MSSPKSRKPDIRFVLRIDDACPSMRMERLEPFVRAAERIGLRPLIGVVPDNANPGLLALGPERPAFWGEMRDLAARGWTIAQHGDRHIAETTDPGIMGINAKSEFAGLDRAAQDTRVARGQARLADEGLATTHFMPPYHSFDDVTLDVLRSRGFVSVSDGYGLWPYRRGGLVLAPQLFSSFRTFGPGVYTVCLHPNDMDPDLIETTVRTLDRRRDRFIPYEDALALCRDDPAAAVARGLSRMALAGARRLRGWARPRAPSATPRIPEATDRP